MLSQKKMSAIEARCKAALAINDTSKLHHIVCLDVLALLAHIRELEMECERLRSEARGMRLAYDLKEAVTGADESPVTGMTGIIMPLDYEARRKFTAGGW